MVFSLDVDVEEPDERSMITYISSLYDAFPSAPSVEQAQRDAVRSYITLFSPLNLVLLIIGL